MDKFDDLFQNQALLFSAWTKESIADASNNLATEKRHRCAVCQQSFSRAEHLKRHSTRHTGAKPFTCTFCARRFSRKDRLQTHYNHCQQRGDQHIPESVPKGRKPHACVICVSTKVRCDGGDPCSHCVKKRVQCRQKALSYPELISNDGSAEPLEPLEDRLSIRALLNGGTDTFTETFNLPPCDDRVRSLQYHSQAKENDDVDGTEHDNTPHGYDAVQEIATFFGSPDTLDTEFFHFWPGPFDLAATPTEIEFPDTFGPSFWQPGPSNISPSVAESIIPPEHIQCAQALHSALIDRLVTLKLDENVMRELRHYLDFLLTSEKLSKLTSLYFRNWHLNCPMIHRPTFDLASTHVCLIISIIFIGAMYSKDQAERQAAKKLVDIAELVVFESEIFSNEAEIAAIIQTNSASAPSQAASESGWRLLQQLQGGFLMVIAQYWAGPRDAKNRAMESRWSDVIRAVRRLGLLQARHRPSDRISETVWLRKESSIRTICMIVLLDCAMRIYSNFPCRIDLSELQHDLPCKDATFRSQHPFMEDNTIFANRLTVSDAFASLFDAKATSRVNRTSTEEESDRDAVTTDTNCDPGLTNLDLFLLIHREVLLTYIHSYITALGHSLNFQHPHSSRQPVVSSKRGVNGPIANDIKHALRRWRSLWQIVSTQSSDPEWKQTGMYRNAFHFWLVAQLIMTKDNSVEVVARMETKCEDALTRLKALLQNDSD